MWGKGKRFWFQRVVLALIALCCLLPMIYLLYASLAGRDGVSQYEKILLDSKEFYTWFWNSACYTALILLIHIPVSILAAYGLSQFRFPGRNVLFFLYMLLMLLPFQATSVPQYLTLDALDILDTGKAVILPCAYGAFGTFLLTQFMRGIDGEILEAARLDGVISKIKNAMQSALTKIQKKLMQPEVKQAGKQQIQEKAKESILAFLKKAKQDSAQREYNRKKQREKQDMEL